MIWNKKKKEARTATHTAAEVANAFLDLAKREGKSLSNMQLQKLVYIAFGYYAAIINSRLFNDTIEAWDYGPVIPNLYHSLKKFGAGEVSEFLETGTAIGDDDPEMKIISGVWDSYKKYSGPQLSVLTHQDGTPWKNTWQKAKRHVVIPFHEIRSHYEQLFRKQNG